MAVSRERANEMARELIARVPNKAQQQAEPSKHEELLAAFQLLDDSLPARAIDPTEHATLKENPMSPLSHDQIKAMARHNLAKHKRKQEAQAQPPPRASEKVEMTPALEARIFDQITMLGGDLGRLVPRRQSGS